MTCRTGANPSASEATWFRIDYFASQVVNALRCFGLPLPERASNSAPLLAVAQQ